MVSPLPVEAIAVRLADEGVPLRAIARATKTSSDILREQLTSAQADGRLLDLPRDDWPPGFPRDQRALQLSRMVVEDREAVLLAVQYVFKLTATEVGLFMTLLQHAVVAKARTDMSDNAIDVHMFHIRRRLMPFGIALATLRGYGYQLSVEARRQVMDLIMAHLGQNAHDPREAIA